jgi:hypothetical protein
MGMRKFGSAAPPFGKVACVVKRSLNVYFSKNPTTSTVILIMPIVLEKASKEGVRLLYADG